MTGWSLKIATTFVAVAAASALALLFTIGNVGPASADCVEPAAATCGR